MAQDGSPLMEFYQRFQNLELFRDSSDQLIKDLMVYAKTTETALHDEVQELKTALKFTKLDLEDATRSRRELQEKIQRYESDIERVSYQHDLLRERNPYITVLIDGDGLIFQQKWIRQGIEGGKKAAYALRSAVASYCEGDAQVEISCKVVANLGGLAKAMLRDGSIDDTQLVKDFSLGFTQAQASFDFIDVGYGKERADSKIKETTRWHLQNHNCKQILLGVSHDAGYAPFLDEIMQDEVIRQQITILEGYPTVRELRQTGAHIIALGDSLFRTDKLVDRQGGVFQHAPPKSASPVENDSTSTPATTASHDPSPQSSYANAAQRVKSASPPPQMSLPLAPKNPNGTKTKKPAVWSPGPHGLDEPLQVNSQVLEAIKKRKDSSKLCNTYYLRGTCTKGITFCPFTHDYEATNEDLDAIAYLNRIIPCSDGQDCTNDDCIYGHHCPSMKDGMCLHPYCKFTTDAHPPGTKFVTKFKNGYIDKNN